MQFEALLSMIVPQQFTIRIEEHSVVAAATGDPNRQIRCFKATAWLTTGTGTFQIVFKNHQTDGRSGQNTELRQSLEDFGKEKTKKLLNVEREFKLRCAYIMIFIANIDNTVVQIGCRTSRQQQGDNVQ